MLEQLLNQFNLYVWAKDKSYRYIYVNENYARAAGMDSPHQMIGKTDDQMPWGDLADDFKRGDLDVLNGASRLNSMEKTDTVVGITDILVSETQFLDATGKVVGVQGSFVDMTGKQIIKTPGYYDATLQRYYLGIYELGDIYFTLLQLEIFKHFVQGKTAAHVAEIMGVSPKTIESHIIYIKRKFGVSTKSELMKIATQYGLTHLVDVRIK